MVSTIKEGKYGLNLTKVAPRVHTSKPRGKSYLPPIRSLMAYVEWVSQLEDRADTKELILKVCCCRVCGQCKREI